MEQTGCPKTATDFRTVALKYIRHKIILSRMYNYRFNQQFQLHIQRLRDLMKWLDGDGKFVSQQRVFTVIKNYKPDFYGSLPYSENSSYQSSNETLKEIFE